jgi:GntR family transcriptional regulator/MocR family aminotransferase
MDAHGKVIYIGNLSKVLFPALRLGYMILPSKAIARLFATAKSVIEGQSTLTNQVIVTEFIRQGHFSRHIRKMKLLYKKAQDDLVNLVNLHLPGQLTPVPVEAGMHLVAWLNPGIEAEQLVAEAIKVGVIITPVSGYAIKYKQPGGVLLGFSGFTFPELEAGVIALKRVIGELGAG